MNNSQTIGAYSATVLARERIDLLSGAPLRSLWERDTILRPHFFLASVVPGAWAPCVVAVHQKDALVGIVYAKERCVFGLRTGIVYADGSLNNIVVAQPEVREEVLRTALEYLAGLPGVRGLRLVIPPGGFERRAASLTASALALDVHSYPLENHSSLPVPATYAAYLQSLGYRTRRNFRYYRRQFEAAGHRFEESLSAGEFEAGAAKLSLQCSVASQRKAVSRVLRMVGAAPRPLRIGLRHRNGDLLGVAGGWWDEDRATLLCQWNHDLEFSRQSLSVVLRGYLIESLIRQQAAELRFWAGSGGPLSRYASFVPAVQVYLDAPSPGWRLMRRLIALAGSRLPSRMAENVSWIVPLPGPALVEWEDRAEVEPVSTE